MHSWIAPYKLRTETRNIFFNKWMFEKEILGKKEGKCAAIKKPSTGRFWIFYSVHLCGKKKELYSSVWRLRCAISMELLTLVCVCNIFTSTADLVLPRCLLMADGTCLCTDVAMRTNTWDCYDDLILFWDVPTLFHSHIYTPFWKDKVLCVAWAVFMI